MKIARRGRLTKMDTLAVDGTRVNKMKTLKNKKGNKFVRVPNKKAAEIADIKELLAKGWGFCSKSEWKEKVRDAKPKKVAEKATKRQSKKKDKK